jgi:hypothetical protein
MNAVNVSGMSAGWIHLVVTGILVLLASGCCLVFLWFLYAVSVGHRWDLEAAFALSTLAWLASLTTYMAMFGVARASGNMTNRERSLVWGRRVLAASSVLFSLLLVPFAIVTPGGFKNVGWVVAAFLLVWLVRRKRT